MALDGDPIAMRLCMERVLPPCRERAVEFSLPAIAGIASGEASGPSAGDIALAMDAVTSALAQGEITLGEAEKIAGVVDTFVRAIETTKNGSRLNILEILTSGSDDEDSCDEDDYEEATDDEEGNDYDA